MGVLNKKNRRGRVTGPKRGAYTGASGRDDISKEITMKAWATRMAATMLLLMAAGTLRAGGLDIKRIPSDAKWIVHLDADAVQKSRLFEIIKAKADQGANGQLQQKLDALSTLLGSRLPQ